MSVCLQKESDDQTKETSPHFSHDQILMEENEACDAATTEGKKSYIVNVFLFIYIQLQLSVIFVFFCAILESVPVSKKSKMLEDLFGNSFFTGDPSARIKSSRELAHDELVKYRDVASLSLDGKVLEWWRAHQTEFPLMADLAKAYLCIPGTSVPSERVFSTAGDIVRSERSVLSCEHVDHLVFLKKNLSKSTIDKFEL